MNRKNTILIAVMINAALLVLLFITAITTREEILPAMPMGDSLSKMEPIEAPLFGEKADLALRSEEPAPVARSESQVVHALPPVVPEAPAAASEAPAASPSAEGHIEIVVKKGDSLDKIAKSHHTTVDEIIKINHLPSSFLRVGQHLKVPIERGRSLMLPAPKPVASTAAPAEALEYYTIKVGGNPWTIAMKHHMKVEDLLRLNGLNEEKARKLKPGDRLRVR